MNPPSRREAYMRAMGLVPWALRAAPVIGSESVTALDDAPAVTAGQDALDAPADASGMDWEGLRAAVAGCRQCALHRSRSRTVFGVGHPAARWMLVGEAPGAEEDRQGEPFVGRAGKLLDAMLQAVGLERGQVFIANVLKCRPPENRDPLPGEAAACAGWLARQVELVQPRLMLALGRIAAQRLLETDAALGSLRGRVHRHPVLDVPVVVTYHPAYLLRAPRDKPKAWNDLLLAWRLAAGREVA